MQETILQEHCNNRVVRCKKKARKNSKYSRNHLYIENRPSSKGYRLCKIIGLGQKLKMPKACEKRFFRNISVVLCKKPLEKIPNI